MEEKNIENTNDSTHLRSPHEAIFLVLAYLPVFELIGMSQVCMSLRDAVQNDILPWLNVIVDKPLSKILSDHYLIKITSKSNGLLRSLALINCSRVTDDGLLRVVADNPLLEKLFVPVCTRLTPGGVIKAVKMIRKLKCLKINGIYEVNQGDLQTLAQLIGVNSLAQTKMFNLYHHRHRIISSAFGHDDELYPSIDVEICPRCQEVRMVFDCPRESCMTRLLQQFPPTQRLQIISCRACYYCILRCEECGVCIKDEVGEAACTDILCLDCWLKLPKCNFCNKAYCTNHVDQKIEYPDSSDGFLCGACNEEHIDDYSSLVSSPTDDEE